MDEREKARVTEALNLLVHDPKRTENSAHAAWMIAGLLAPTREEA